MATVASTHCEAPRSLRDPWRFQRAIWGGGIKGVKRVHSSSGTVKKKRKVLWEDVFKNRTQEIGKKDSRTRSYTVNLYPSPLCLRKQVVKNAQ